ncbi:MAG: hypothetical protein MUC59_13240 [Saprospiraceae bacterium]|nr:hypothetical protein [Saprospiraceae bacterium]
MSFTIFHVIPFFINNPFCPNPTSVFLALVFLLLTTSCLKKNRSHLEKEGTTLTIKNDSILLLQSIDTSGMTVFEVYHHRISSKTLRKREVYFPDGSPVILEYFDYSGRLNGVRREYYENGYLSTEEHYRNGIKHGRFRYFHPNGQTYWSTNFEDGKAHGGDTSWTKEGIVKEIFNFDHDLVIDTGFIFNVNGRDSIHYYFKNGSVMDSTVFR